MALRLLHTSQSLHIFHDTDYNWLYLDWQGGLSLAAARAGWLQLTRCLLDRPYACVLNSNAQVTHVEPSVGRWLVRGFERFVQLSGIRQIAWVYASHAHGFGFAEAVAAALPRLQLSLFADEEQAVTWLQQYGHYERGSSGYPHSHPAAARQHLHRLARVLARQAEELLVPVELPAATPRRIFGPGSYPPSARPAR